MHKEVSLQELVYLSHAKVKFSKRELTALLELSRKNNSQRDVTGILLYDGEGMFIQAIEGERGNVDALFEKIRQDDRHERIVVLWRGEIETRKFPDWKMGFKEVNADVIDQLDGFSDYLNIHDEATYTDDDADFTRVLLQHFKGRTP